MHYKNTDFKKMIYPLCGKDYQFLIADTICNNYNFIDPVIRLNTNL